MVHDHTSSEYQAELDELRERLLLMAGRVEEMIRLSVRSVVESDSQLAEETILKDRLVNRDELEIDEMCLVLLARRQPMGTDLRFITRSMKMVTDLERIGDLAVNICERAKDLSTLEQLRPYVRIPKMATKVQDMVHETFDAFIYADADRARHAIDMDDEVDELYHQVIRTVLEVASGNDEVYPQTVHVQGVAKLLERIGDHATNVAEQVIFMVDGTDIRHEGKLH
ncbi:MAG: phosphate signaling complex protein PhoU [Myxococcota bacterium]|nr:phosphate signaling complex protein PhoU [Myxococcota bacterium]